MVYIKYAPTLQPSYFYYNRVISESRTCACVRVRARESRGAERTKGKKDDMKSVLISIKPKWCELIASGKKTVEVRKTRPKLDPPFKVYIYCTKNTKKNALHTYIRSGYGRKTFGIIEQWRSGKEVVDVNAHLPAYRYNAYLAEGKVIGEFVCDRIIDIPHSQYFVDYYHTMPQADLESTCLDMGHIDEYLLSKDGYGWHISDLVIYDQPRGLTGFYHYCGDDPKCDGCELLYYSNTECGKEEFCCSNMYGCKHLERPPQSWCYVVEGGE